MKKSFLFLLVGLLSATVSFSQSFMHGAGFNVVVATASGGKTAVYEGLSYTPRVNFIEQENLSVSVGIPFTVGLSGSYNSRNDGYSEGNTLSFMLNAPLLVNLNMGAGSSKENEDRFGYFVGAGFGYHYGTFNISDALDGNYAATKSSTVGPVANAGVRIGVGSSGHFIEIRAQYMKGLKDYKPNIFGIGAAYGF